MAPLTPNVAIQEMSLGIHYNVGHDLLEFCSDREVLTPQDGFLAIPAGPGEGPAPSGPLASRMQNAEVRSRMAGVR